MNKRLNDHRAMCKIKPKKDPIPSDLPALPTQRVFNLFVIDHEREARFANEG